ncbi:hypothetical protein PPERSA_11251 [Pseudocohnilembus persalinus]|uniref:Uncharacterized protein n=1 Tax=Pseudocohnilembus persalinus TaxID=266149 RepID=A0A0V0QZJ9_PSEPJ|nr:hypothetical protein PPERSA_11251 [Pseudocohnilembus persalinus]|eukprot:KRX07702.1 hypothetical protein PPERSA_11251 [Pseudocohnilembus persalinus]
MSTEQITIEQQETLIKRQQNPHKNQDKNLHKNQNKNQNTNTSPTQQQNIQQSHKKKIYHKHVKLIHKAYKFLQSKVESPEIKKQFLSRQIEETPKYRGQIHNYGKWISLIPSILLIICARSFKARRNAIIYSIGVFWMQFISSKMHCRPYQTAPTWIRKLDNISIFLYIGMNWFTIFEQVMIEDPKWEVTFGLVTVLMVVAIILRALTLHSPRWLISGIALLMGWLSIILLPTIIQKLNTYEQTVFALGGLSITLGAVCWALQFPKKKKGSHWTPHETFHLGTFYEEKI